MATPLHNPSDMRAFASLALVLAAAACSSATNGGSGGSAEPLVLTVDTPTRGTTVDGTSVTVSGHATGGHGALTVTVAGQATPVGADGSFSAATTVTDGIDIVETHAKDSEGADVRDVRAVLAGTLAATDGTHAAPMATHASPSALTAIGNAMAGDAAKVDYTSVAEGLNPIYDNGGCLGATVNITNVSLSGVDVGLAPKAGALTTNVTIHDVSVQLHASFKVACIGGSGTITVTSSAAHISGDLGVDVSSGKLETALPSSSVTLDNFNVSVSGIPSEVTGLFNGIIKGKVQTALANAIQSKVPSIANGELAGLLTKPFDESVLGADVSLGVTPTAATIDSSGVYVAVDTTINVASGSGGVFLTEATQDASAALASSPDLGVAIANDVVNQLLGGLWAANAFDMTVQLSSIPGAGALLDPNATQLAVSMSLPPTAATDPSGNLNLAVGDAILSVQDASGNELQRIALSVQTGMSISATANNKLAMTLGNPTVYAQVLVQSQDTAPLADSELESIVKGVWSTVGQQASTALAKLPMPAIAGVQLGEPTVSSTANYVVADIPLQ